jgi:hypothetical protein
VDTWHRWEDNEMDCMAMVCEVVLDSSESGQSVELWVPGELAGWLNNC